VDRARDLRSQRRRRGTRTSSYEESDQVWAVFDQDRHPRIDEVLTMCRDNRVAAARSNPCFELWLILHFEDYDRPATPRDVQTRLHALCPEYHHEDSPSPSFARLMTEVHAAEDRAARQLHLRVWHTRRRRRRTPVTSTGAKRRMRENRLSGGVGGVTGAIPSPRPDSVARRCMALVVTHQGLVVHPPITPIS
jgi:hypothetical protein